MKPPKAQAAPPPDYRPAPGRALKSSPLATVMALVVGCVLIASLLISAAAIAEKIRLSHGLSQIIDIVGSIREAATSDQRIGQTPNEDLLDDMQRVFGTQTTGVFNGRKTLDNPWRGQLTAFVASPQVIRVETNVPPYICRRIIDMFGNDPQAFGVRQIDVRQPQQEWKTVYAGPDGEQASDTQIAAACGSVNPSGMAMMFGLVK